MADDRHGWDGNGSGGTLFTNVRILDATGEYPYTGEVLDPGQPHQKQITRGSSRSGSGARGLGPGRRWSTASGWRR